MIPPFSKPYGQAPFISNVSAKHSPAPFRFPSIEIFCRQLLLWLAVFRQRIRFHMGAPLKQAIVYHLSVHLRKSKRHFCFRIPISRKRLLTHLFFYIGRHPVQHLVYCNNYILPGIRKHSLGGVHHLTSLPCCALTVYKL